MLTRNAAPVLGAQNGPYLDPGEWQLGATYRTFRADKQFTGTRVNDTVMKLNSNIITKLQLLDLTGSYQVNDRLNVTLGVPILVYGSSSRALPANQPNSPRFVQSASGLGDLMLVGRYWVLDPTKEKEQNISLGLGIKAPTGNANAKDRFPDARGLNPQLRPVDPSIQPGDGGWGVLLDFQGFKQVGTLTLFANGTYLINPRGETGTLSPRSFLNPNGPSAVARSERFNTVADQYLLRVGASHPVPGAKGLSVFLAVRWEGVPQEDLFGETIGFRRPGYVISLEPGLSYTRGQTTYAFSATIATQVNRQSVDGVPGDSTFADFSLIASVTHRFGKGD